MIGEFDHRAGQQLQRPADGLVQAVATGRASSLPVTFRSAPTLLVAHSPLRIAFYEAPLGPLDSGAAHRHDAVNFLATAASVRRQQNLGSLELPDSAFALAQHCGQFVAFSLAQLDPITYVHSARRNPNPQMARNQPTKSSVTRY